MDGRILGVCHCLGLVAAILVCNIAPSCLLIVLWLAMLVVFSQILPLQVLSIVGWSGVSILVC